MLVRCRLDPTIASTSATASTSASASASTAESRLWSLPHARLRSLGGVTEVTGDAEVAGERREIDAEEEFEEEFEEEASEAVETEEMTEDEDDE